MSCGQSKTANNLELNQTEKAIQAQINGTDTI
jgi:hypothetical protein